MRIGNGTFAYRGAPPVSTSPAPTPRGPSRETLRAQLERVDAEVDDLRAVLRSIRGNRSQGLALPRTVGSLSDLSSGATTAVLQSAAEVNTEATSLATRTPEWTGTGTRAVSVAGVYSGTTDEVLTFTVTSANGRDITATNKAGQVVGTYRLGIDASDFTSSIGNGLTVTLKGGARLTQGDSFAIDMRASEDGAIDPADAFNGRGLASPRFEQGVVITAGSFKVNGTTVTVAANDTLNAVLDRISTTVAGVVATYDAGTERVRLETTGTGSNQTLAITDDTSGLIAALKLGGLGQARGADDQVDRTLSQAEGLQGTNAGTITVNGTAIAIDPAAQRLSDVLAAINAVDGVTARLDGAGRVEIAGRAGSALDLTDGGTGLLDALGIREGVHRGAVTNRRGLSDFASQRVTAELLQLREALDALVDNEGLLGVAAEMRTRIGIAVETTLRDTDGVRDVARTLGLDDFAIDGASSRNRANREVRQAYGDVRGMMLGQGSKRPGLLDQLDTIISDGLRDLDGIDTRV